MDDGLDVLQVGSGTEVAAEVEAPPEEVADAGSQSDSVLEETGPTDPSDSTQKPQAAAPAPVDDELARLRSAHAAAVEQLRQEQIAKARLQGMFEASQRAPQKSDGSVGPVAQQQQKPPTPDQQWQQYVNHLRSPQYQQSVKENSIRQAQQMVASMSKEEQNEFHEMLSENPLTALMALNLRMQRQTLDFELPQMSRALDQAWQQRVDGKLTEHTSLQQETQFREQINNDWQAKLGAQFPTIREYYTTLMPEEQQAFGVGVWKIMDQVASVWKDDRGNPWTAEQALDWMYRNGDEANLAKFVEAVGQSIVSQRKYLSPPPVAEPAVVTNENGGAAPRRAPRTGTTKPSARMPVTPSDPESAESLLESLSMVR